MHVQHRIIRKAKKEDKVPQNIIVDAKEPESSQLVRVYSVINDPGEKLHLRNIENDRRSDL